MEKVAALVFLLAVLTYLTCADPVTTNCVKTADCTDLTSVKTNYCYTPLTGASTCSALTQATFGTSLVNPLTTYCVSSYYYLGAGSACINLYGAGCAKPASTSFSYCVGGSWNGTTCQLTQAPASSITYVAAGGACDNVQNICGYNLVCLRKTCQKLPAAGDFCLNGQCTNGNICNLGKCAAPGSLPAGSGCDSNSACSSGSCGFGFCNYSVRNNRCYTNGDCSAGECDNRNKNSLGQGICFNPAPVAAQNYINCVASQCTNQYYPDVTYQTVQACGLAKCASQYVQQQCASMCSQRPDNQFNLNMPYRFDCQASTLTALGASDCGVSNQFTNCNAYQNYQNSSFAVKSSWIFVLAAIALVVMMI